MARKHDPEKAPAEEHTPPPAPEAQTPAAGGRYVRLPDGTLVPAPPQESEEA